jgi:hypothetical protein
MILPPRVVSPGIHAGTIEAAELVCYEWRRSAKNPQGLALRVRVRVVDELGQADLLDAADITNDSRLTSIFSAAGLEVPGDNLAAASERLIGRPVTITAKTITPQHGKHAGKSKSVVGTFLPQPESTTT